MPYTLYDTTITVAQGLLKTLQHILQKASQHPSASTICSSRLHESMYPLTDQIRLATQYSENLAARLTSRQSTTYTETLLTLPQCLERITLVLKSLEGVERERVEAGASVEEETQLGPERRVMMSHERWATFIVLPNVYFHVVTAYDILRKEGVEVGKRDYYAGFFGGV